MQRLARLAAVGTVATLLFTATPTTVTADDRVTITGTVSATPATGAAEVAIAVKTAPAAGKKSLVADIKGTVIIVTLAPGVAVKRNGVTVPLSDLRANDQVAITIRSRIGTSAPYKYVASKFMATTPNANYAMTVDGYIATAPPEYATSIMVFVKTFSTSKFYPSTNLRNTTIQVALAPGATVTRNGVATTLAGLKLNDRVLLTLTERSGSAAPFTYIASRVVATAANSTLPVTMTGSIVATPASGATTISVYVKTVSNDVGWANDALKGTTVLDVAHDCIRHGVRRREIETKSTRRILRTHLSGGITEDFTERLVDHVGCGVCTRNCITTLEINTSDGRFTHGEFSVDDSGAVHEHPWHR